MKRRTLVNKKQAPLYRKRQKPAAQLKRGCAALEGLASAEFRRLVTFHTRFGRRTYT